MAWVGRKAVYGLLYPASPIGRRYFYNSNIPPPFFFREPIDEPEVFIAYEAEAWFFGIKPEYVSIRFLITNRMANQGIYPASWNRST